MTIKLKIQRVLYKMLPLNIYLNIMYKKRIGRKLNLKNPSTFTEKLFWLKIYNGKYLSDLINKIHDKYDARSYVEKVIGTKYLSNIYGVYDKFEEIKFDELPNQFVLKLTKMSGMNIVCKDKGTFDLKKAADLFNKWTKVPGEYKEYSEEAYTFLGKPRILCEELIFADNTKPPLEYQVLCFNGKAKLIIVDDAVVDQSGQLKGFKRNTYDTDWNIIPVDFGRKRASESIFEKPYNLDEIIEISEKLASPFPFVRVDLYNINDKIIFRELTWIPMGGNINIEPKEYDELWGDWLELPDVDLF